MPKISVIIRTFNSADYVSAAIQSVLDQTLPSEDIEVLIVDDHSTDAIEEIATSFGDAVCFLKNEGKGAMAGINTGIRNATAPFVTLLDSDDEFLPHTLEKLSLAMNDEVHFVYSDYYEKTFEGEEKVVTVGENLYNLIAIGILFRKTSLEQIGGYDESLIFPEYDVMKQFTDRGFNGSYVQEPLFIYKRREGSITSEQEVIEKGKQQLKEKHGVELPIREY